MNITIVEPKRKKGSFYESAVIEYEKRLTRYIKLKTTNKIDKKWWEKEGCVVFQLQVGKDTISSEELAEKISEYSVSGTSHLIFCIGEIERNEQQEMIPFSFCSLSPSNEMTSVLLREQIYRAYRILNHEPYHK